VLFAQTVGIIPAPETAHAIKAAVDEALKCKEEGTKKVIAFNFSGHGLLNLAAYDSYLQDDLVDCAHPEEMILETTKDLPEIPEGLLVE
jgi:tryptophan synthase beta chain